MDRRLVGPLVLLVCVSFSVFLAGPGTSAAHMAGPRGDSGQADPKPAPSAVGVASRTTAADPNAPASGAPHQAGAADPNAPSAVAPREQPAPGGQPGKEAADRAEYLAKATDLITDRNYDSETTAHYCVRTDDPRLDAKEAARLLESFRGWFEGFWSGHADLDKHEERSEIFLFYSRYKYTQLLGGADRAVAAPIVGHYAVLHDLVALHTDTVGLGDLPDVLVHEAAHQQVRKRLYPGDHLPSPWVSEGLASYFGYTLRDDEGKFQTGRIGGKGTSFFKQTLPGSARSARMILSRFRGASGKDAPLMAGRLIRTDDYGEFYGPAVEVRYPMAWLLVHYLFHGDGGAHASRFAKYVQDEARGEGGPDAFYRGIDMTPEALDAAFTEYVRRLKAR